MLQILLALSAELCLLPFPRIFLTRPPLSIILSTTSSGSFCQIMSCSLSTDSPHPRHLSTIILSIPDSLAHFLSLSLCFRLRTRPIPSHLIPSPLPFHRSYTLSVSCLSLISQDVLRKQWKTGTGGGFLKDSF